MAIDLAEDLQHFEILRHLLPRGLLGRNTR